MMTPSEFREYEFKGAGRNAYKADDVDAFFGEVAVAYEKLYRENTELAKRISLIADRLEKYKNQEDEIKQAVLSAQKAADIIVKQAEESVEDTKAESEAILAAAKGEAEIIKADAEKQAIADSDLLLSIARDKAEDIINKAKEQAHGILIEANASASDTVGAATRTITSESIHYEMLKKEVSEFRASILAQYKAHIEMISKLPELAAEEAAKLEPVAEEESPEAEVNEFNADDSEETAPSVEFVDDVEEETFDFLPDEAELESEDVVKTTLPYDFFEEDGSLEFVEEAAEDNEASSDVSDIDDFVKEFAEPSFDNVDEFVENQPEEAEDDEQVSDDNAPADIPISRGFSIDTSKINDDDLNMSVFDSIESINFNVDEEDVNDEYDDEDGDDTPYDDDEDDSRSKGFFGFLRGKK